MEKHLNNLHTESLKVSPKMHKGKTKYMTNYPGSEDLLTEQEKLKRGQHSKTSNILHISKILQEKKSMPESEQHGVILGGKTTSMELFWEKKQQLRK